MSCHRSDHLDERAYSAGARIGKPRFSRPRSGPTLPQELSDVVDSMARGYDRLSELVRRACQFFAPVTNGLRVGEVHQRYSWPSCCLAIHMDSTRRADGLQPRVTSFNGVSFDVTAACDKPASEWAAGHALTHSRRVSDGLPQEESAVSDRVRLPVITP